MKKIFSLLITLCAVLFAQTSFAANEITRVTQDGIIYSLLDDNTAYLGNGGDATGDVTLPTVITYEGKDYTLTGIRNSAFWYANITSITIPNSVSTIGEYAFEGCNSLQFVTIGAFVQSIGKGTFQGCSNLKEMVFYPTKVPTVGELTIPNSKNFQIKCFNQSSYRRVLDKFYNFEFEIVDLTNNSEPYYHSIIEAITLAANRVALTQDEIATINGCKDDMTTAFQYYQDVRTLKSLENMQHVIYENELAAHKVIALAGIRQTIPSDGLLDGEQTVINGKIASISSATSLGEIYTPQKEALDIMAMHPERKVALAAIEEAMQGNADSKYLNDIVKKQVDAINNATGIVTINDSRNAAVNILKGVMDTYIAAKEEGETSALGSLGTKQNGPAVKVTDKDDNEIILYAPKKVEYIKVKEKLEN